MTAPTIPPTPPSPDNLEHQLQDLTTYRGEPTDLWRKALEVSETPEAPTPFLRRIDLSSIRRHAAAACVFLLVGVLLVGIFLPSMGKARQSARQLKDSTQLRGLHQGLVTQSQNNGDRRTSAVLSLEPPPPPSAQPGSWEETDRAKAALGDRSVIQKATIEIETPDVRAAYAKAVHLVSEAGGEFVENSALTGDGKSAHATLTLRVGVARLSEVMNRLRELGLIKSENTTGEDVTGQVVDLEARIRNEQRIEKELLDLLEKRKDAPLKDILDLRTTLSNVRQTIEQLIGQRDRIDRLVSLASILVVIRAEPEKPAPPPQPEPPPSIASHFKANIAAAWRDSLLSLSDSLSWLLSLLISGTLWWLAIAAAILSIRKYRRRLSARCV